MFMNKNEQPRIYLSGEQRAKAVVHPGWVRTELTAGNINAPLSTEESAKAIFDFIGSDYKTGIYWNAPEKKEIEW
jgi:hypothetical protein